MFSVRRDHHRHRHHHQDLKRFPFSPLLFTLNTACNLWLRCTTASTLSTASGSYSNSASTGACTSDLYVASVIRWRGLQQERVFSVSETISKPDLTAVCELGCCYAAHTEGYGIVKHRMWCQYFCTQSPDQNGADETEVKKGIEKSVGFVTLLGFTFPLVGSGLSLCLPRPLSTFLFP